MYQRIRALEEKGKQPECTADNMYYTVLVMGDILLDGQNASITRYIILFLCCIYP